MKPKRDPRSYKSYGEQVNFDYPEDGYGLMPSNDGKTDADGTGDSTEILLTVEAKVFPGKKSLAAVPYKPFHDPDYPQNYVTGVVSGNNWDFADANRIPIAELGTVNTLVVWADYRSMCYGRNKRWFVPVPDVLEVGFTLSAGADECAVFDTAPIVFVTRQSETNIWKGNIDIGGGNELYVRVTQTSTTGVSKYQIEFGCSACAEAYQVTVTYKEPDSAFSSFFDLTATAPVPAGPCCADATNVDIWLHGSAIGP